MDTDRDETLTRIERGNHETARALKGQADLLRTVVKRLDEVVDLLTPKDSDDGGMRLDDLLAHLVAQQTQMIMLLKQVAAGVMRIEKNQPLGDVDAARSGRLSPERNR